jgi:DNA-binding GntR family transcriptional regulator
MTSKIKPETVQKIRELAEQKIQLNPWTAPVRVYDDEQIAELVGCKKKTVRRVLLGQGRYSA